MASKPNSTESKESFPPVLPALVEALDARFPLRSPAIDWPDRQVWIEAGQRKVIDFLRSRLSDDIESALTSGENTVVTSR